MAVVFYKVTCPVCQMSAPKFARLQQAYPGRVAGVGEDPPEKLSAFKDRFGLGFESVEDASPYPVSDAYGVEVVPTTFLVDDGGVVQDVVESWDRDGLNRLSAGLAQMAGADPVTISEADDGLPSFRPG